MFSSIMLYINKCDIIRVTVDTSLKKKSHMYSENYMWHYARTKLIPILKQSTM